MMTSTLLEFPGRMEITLRDGIPAIARRLSPDSRNGWPGWHRGFPGDRDSIIFPADDKRRHSRLDPHDYICH